MEFLLWFSCNRTELWLATLQTFVKFGKRPGVRHAAVFAHRMNNRANSGDLSKDLLHLIMRRNAVVWMSSQDCIACFVVGVDGAFQQVEEEFEWHTEIRIFFDHKALGWRISESVESLLVDATTDVIVWSHLQCLDELNGGAKIIGFQYAVKIWRWRDLWQTQRDRGISPIIQTPWIPWCVGLWHGRKCRWLGKQDILLSPTCLSQRGTMLLTFREKTSLSKVKLDSLPVAVVVGIQGSLYVPSSLPEHFRICRDGPDLLYFPVAQPSLEVLGMPLSRQQATWKIRCSDKFNLSVSGRGYATHVRGENFAVDQGETGFAGYHSG